MNTVLRKEIKYVVYRHEFAALRAKLQIFMQRDDNGGDFGYVVRSLYFDSADDEELSASVDGLFRKSKIRLRIYGEKTQVKLEIKQKEGSDSLKRSLMVTREEAEAMQNCDYEFLRNRPEPLARTIYMQLMKGAYQPKTLVEYDREAYIHPVGRTRITFDTDVRATASAWDLFSQNPPWTPIMPPGTGVLEIKYSSILPPFLKEAVETGRLSVANSKYVQARQFYQFGGDV